jgi:DNA-binding Xre family transcriptional regulator
MLAWDMEELAEKAGIPIERLEAIRDGKSDRPQPDELVGLSRATGFTFEQLEKLARQGEHQSNGCHGC